MRCQRVLFSAYRTDQYADPDGFLTSLGAVLEQYPNEVVIYVTDPRTGVQRGQKFPPTIAEIVTACEDRAAYLAQQKRFDNWGRNEPAMVEGPRQNRPSYDELKAKYGETWGIGGDPEQSTKPKFISPTIDELQVFYSRNPERVARLMGETGPASQGENQ